MKTLKNGGARTECGSLLPLLALTLLCGALLLALLLRAGSLLIVRERARARTDIVAFSGGIGYARALNVLASSDQALAGAAGLALVTLGTQSQPFFYIQRAQRAGIQVLPWMTEASVLHLGARNGMAALPLWNTRSPWPDPEALRPDIHVHQAGVVEKLLSLLGPVGKALPEQAVKEELSKAQDWARDKLPASAKDRAQDWIKRQLPDLDLDRLLKTAYSYKKKGSGQRVEVDVKDVYHRQERQKNGRVKRRAHERGSDKYLREDKKFNLDLPLDLEDDGEHYLLVLSWTPTAPNLIGPFGLPGPPGFANLSCVRIAGGSMNALSVDAAEYGAFFVAPDATLDMGSLLRSRSEAASPQPPVLH